MQAGTLVHIGGGAHLLEDEAGDPLDSLLADRNPQPWLLSAAQTFTLEAVKS